ncbi:MAG: hypothetical protein A2252_03370 [Elusimicrobia bacterium RIFOXYA2_FULL_39_19]|nr:MAG: hypothetical protein A2252_03370 [Elusimicrobia bacterium RIFOXYA2_FULL_39_19]
MRNILFLIMFTVFVSGVNAIEIPLQGIGGMSMGYVDMNKLFEYYPPVKTAKQDYEKLKNDKKLEFEKLATDIEILKSSATESETQLKQLKQELIAAKNRVVYMEQQKQRQLLENSTTTFTENVPVQVSSQTLTNETTVAINDMPLTTPPPPATTYLPPPPPPPSSIQSQENVPNIEDIQRRISEKETEIALIKDAVLKKQQENTSLKKKSDKALKDYEKNRTMALIGELYKIIEELAKEEDISIVIEKSNILYGTGGTDLTDKVLERLRGK